ncbi:MAG: protein kinase [Myxococcales bacterium]|nr:protein kinase [Myxococcales bacterium]
MTGPKTPDDLLDSAETVSVETQAVARSTTGERYAEGDLIGDKYRLLRRLGEGGMASVWVAHNEALDIHVAIKFIRAELEHADLGNRLLQEARAAARLGHPAIVRVSDFGKTPRGDPYIVMELLNGEDLSVVLKRKGPMPPLKAVRTLLPIADALAVAHGKKIVHRDLKPENIFLTQEENGKTQPKVVDFGIAKLEVEDSKRITQVGAAMGSPAYMSPEQARGLDVDARTDIWALCVVLYEVLTGQLPFNGNVYTALVVAILEAKPKPITELGLGDAELWSIIAKGLEKAPENRWQTMRELGAALARWAMAHSVADDITGSNLQSSWIERPPDSMPGGALSLLAPAPAPTPAAGHGSTQLSATVSGATPARSRSTLIIVGVAAVVVLGIGFAAVLRALDRDEVKPEPTTAATSLPTTPAEPSAEPKVEPAITASAEPAPSSEPKAGATALPTGGKKPVGKPPVSKPAVKPTETAAKPAEKPPKPPENDLKPL